MTFRDQIIAGRRGTVLIAHSGDGAADRERDGTRVTRRAVIGGVVGAGLLEVLAFAAPGRDRAMAAMAPAGGAPDDGLMDGHLLDDQSPPMFTADSPRIYTRAQWRARPPKRPAKILDRAPDHIIVHHTDTANSTNLTVAHAFSLSRFIQNFHMDHRGWDDAGQQLTISRGGHVMEGRNRSLAAIEGGVLAKGAQVKHHNDHTIGIENEGNYMARAVPGRLWASLMEVCVWLCREYDLDPATAIVGHRDYNDTSCPGDVLYARLPALRRGVAERLDGSPKPKPKPKPKPGGDGDSGNDDDDWGMVNFNDW